MKQNLFSPTGCDDIISMGHEMMSFWRKYVKTFTRQWLRKIGTLKDQHKLYKMPLPVLMFLVICLSYIYRQEVQAWPPPR